MPTKKNGPKTFVSPDKEIVLQNLKGEDMPQEDYFFLNDSAEEKKRLDLPENAKEKARVEAGQIAPTYFNNTAGMPVNREDLIETFNEVFNPKDNFLFYRCLEKEVYIVIVPLKFADIGIETGARTGDCQMHSCSFVMEGSANVDTLKMKLKKMAATMKYTRNRN